MNELLDENVCRVEIDGIAKGTAFLVSEKYALTVFHVVNLEKEGNDKEIKLHFKKDKKPIVATLHNSITTRYKKLDIAILELQNDLVKNEYLTLVDMEVKTGDRWYSRGFPKIKEFTGENLFSEENKVQQVLDILHNHNTNIQLDLDKKYSNYEGLSGSPIIINSYVIGIIGKQLYEGTDGSKKAKELNGLTVSYFKELLLGVGIPVLEKDRTEIMETKVDTVAVKLWEGTVPSDKRNIKEKLEAVCPNIIKPRLSKFCREATQGRLELDALDNLAPRELSSIKLRIFEACNEEHISFIEKKGNMLLTIEEIKILVDEFVKAAKKIIVDRGRNYSYPDMSDDLLRKIVLGLIDECYLSFDEEGVYEEEY